MVWSWEMALYCSLRIYNLRREDGIGITVLDLEELDTSNSSQQSRNSTHHLHVSSIFRKPMHCQGPFYGMHLSRPVLPRSNPPHATSPASKFMLSFISQISSSVDGLRL